MLTTFNWHLKQLLYVEDTMNQVAKFRPDSRTPDFIDELLASSRAVRGTYLERVTAEQTTRAELHQAWETGHRACVSVHALLRSVYREVPVALAAVQAAPVDDRTSAETFTRLEALSKVWEELPNPPNSNKKFVAGDLDKTKFDALFTALDEKLKALPVAEQALTTATTALNAQDDANASLITAALVQGRAQFAEGTNERNLVEGIPTVPRPAPGEMPDVPEANISATSSAVTPQPAPASAPTPVDFNLPRAANQ